MEIESIFARPPRSAGMQSVVLLLRAGRARILEEWIERVRNNDAVGAPSALSDPLLLDHIPQLFDAMLDRLELNRSRDEAEQFATVHGFNRRVTGYDVIETAVELMMFRRAIWAYLTAADAPADEALAAMERIDGMVDRAVVTSLKAFLDPSAVVMTRREGTAPSE